MSQMTSEMRLSWALLAILVVFDGILGVFIFFVDVPFWGAVDHPKFPTMQRSGWSWESNEFLLWWVWIIGILQVALFLCLLGLGLTKKGCLGCLKIPVLAGAFFYALIFSWLVLAHFLPVVPSFWFLPPPTVVMLFMLWPLTPLYFVTVYFFFFDRWILTEEDYGRFLQLVHAQNSRSSK